MGLQSALTTALTGLQAAETTIDVVGNNVANSQTVGFKESEAVFATQFLQTLSIGSSPSTNSGGTNPRQLGLGVKVAEISPNFTQGTIEISSNPLDLAVQGDGFLIVQDGTNRLYTRNGQLKLNAENEVTTPTGQRLLGYTVDDNFNLQTNNLVPLSIPLGQERVAQATANATLNGVLNPAVALGDQPEVIESLVLGTNEIEAPSETFDPSDLFLTDTPDPATATETGAGTSPGTGVYTYRVAFLDANGFESSPSTEFSVTAAGTGAIDLSGIQAADGATFVDKVVYRTLADGNTFYRVGNVDPGDPNTALFTDDITDATITGDPVTYPPLDDNNVDEGSYSYYFTFRNPSTGVETRPTSRIPSPSVSDPSGGRIRINLDQIGAPTNSGFQQIRIYRNLAGQSSTFKLVDEVPSQANGSYVSSYIDNTPSSALTGAADLNLDGPPAGNGTLLSEVTVREGEIFTRPFVPGTLSFAGEKNGVRLDEKDFTITATSTVQDLLDFVRDALGLDQQSSVPFPEPTANVDIVNGQIIVTSNMGEQNAIDIPLTAFSLVPEGETIGNTIALNFNATQQAVGPGTSSEFIAYDSLGLPINVRITTVLEARDGNSTTYRWFATSADNEPLNGTSTVVGDGILTFDGNGDLDDDNPTSRISVARNDTASISPLEVTLDFSSVKALGEVDAQQNPISNLNVTNQDGFPPGVLTDFIITNDGVIQGQFSNGTQRTIGQLVMARFANNGGLQQVGDSLFNVGVNSGDPTFGVPGAEGIGTLSAGAVELSNTDIGQNLIELILASTQYRGGARVITATQELLDELLALSR